MKELLSKYSYLLIWILSMIVIGSSFVVFIKLNNTYFPSGPENTPKTTTAPGVPAKPPAPSVTLTIVKSKTGNSLFVQWQNLPDDTTALNIFRSPINDSSTWLLWKTIQITADELFGGYSQIDLGTAALNGYSFYVEAVNKEGTTASSTGNSSSTTVLWTSTPIEPPVTTSTPGTPPQNGGGPGNPGGPNTTTTNPTSTPPSGNPSTTVPTNNPPNPTSSNPTPSGTPVYSPPTGPIFYNPQVQISGYGATSTNNFSVQHTNSQIQLSWQNLPSGTDSIAISRSSDQNGPWTTILTEQSPDVNASSSLQIVDNTVADSYYYQLEALSGTTTIATYGPAYLPALTQ